MFTATDIIEEYNCNENNRRGRSVEWCKTEDTNIIVGGFFWLIMWHIYFSYELWKWQNLEEVANPLAAIGLGEEFS